MLPIFHLEIQVLFIELITHNFNTTNVLILLKLCLPTTPPPSPWFKAALRHKHIPLWLVKWHEALCCWLAGCSNYGEVTAHREHKERLHGGPGGSNWKMEIRSLLHSEEVSAGDLLLELIVLTVPLAVNKYRNLGSSSCLLIGSGKWIWFFKMVGYLCFLPILEAQSAHI